MVSCPYPPPATSAARTFAFSSIADMHARLHEVLPQAGDDDDYVVFTQTPICALDQLKNNSLLKVVQLDDNNNTATLFFRPISSAHEVANLWLHDTIQNWRSRNNYDDIKAVGESTEYAAGSQRNPDGAWGPAIVKRPRRLLIVEVCFSQSVEDMENKLRFWFDAGARYALLLNIVKETREVSLNLCHSDGLTSHIKAWEDNGRIHKEGTSIVLSPAVIADRENREDDINLCFTAEQLASSLPRILRQINYS